MNNAFLQDKTLEPATIGILAVILSNKDDWDVYPEEIAKRMNISRTTVDRHFKILEKAGYLRVVKNSLGKGKGTKVERFFSDLPFTESHFLYIKEGISKKDKS